MGLPKHAIISGNYLEQLFFRGLNFINDQHPQNLWNLRTFENQLYGIFSTVNVFIYIKPATCLPICGVFY